MLLPDESLSSWFARLAGANALRPGDLFAILQPGGFRYPRDLDRFADDVLLNHLTEATGTKNISIRQATFRRWAGLLYESDDGLNKLAWLPPAGREDSRRSFGQQICPRCVEEDSRPYLRLSWRLAFVIACPKHRCFLVDRCPRCGEPINILRQNRVDRIECWSCGNTISLSTPEYVTTSTLIIQEHLLSVLRDRWAELGGAGVIFAPAFFQLLMLVFRLLSSGKHALPLRIWIGSQSTTLASHIQIPRLREIELLNPRVRSNVLSMASYLLDDWPHRFVTGCRTVGLTRRHLLKSGRQYPFAYQHVVDWHLTSRHRVIKADELEIAKRYLQARGIKPTYRALVELTGVKITSERALVERAAESMPWGTGRYWKIDGVTPEVKSAARRAAHKAGESLSVWLERILRRELDLNR